MSLTSGSIWGYAANISFFTEVSMTTCSITLPGKCFSCTCSWVFCNKNCQCKDLYLNRLKSAFTLLIIHRKTYFTSSNLNPSRTIGLDIKLMYTLMSSSSWENITWKKCELQYSALMNNKRRIAAHYLKSFLNIYKLKITKS